MYTLLNSLSSIVYRILCCYPVAMDWKQVIAHFGSKARLAKRIGLTRSAVSNWGPEIPYLHQCQIEILTQGKLRAEQTRRQEGEA